MVVVVVVVVVVVGGGGLECCAGDCGLDVPWAISSVCTSSFFVEFGSNRLRNPLPVTASTAVIFSAHFRGLDK